MIRLWLDADELLNRAWRSHNSTWLDFIGLEEPITRTSRKPTNGT